MQIYRSITEEPCLDVSHEKTLKDLMDTSPHAGRRSVRQWTYQTCTEFGFCTVHSSADTHSATLFVSFDTRRVLPVQTCEDTTCPFSGMVTLQSETEVCPTVFGVSRPSLAPQIAFTNTYYGGDSPRTHRVLYINGEIFSSSKQRINPRVEEFTRTILITGGIDPWKELSVTQDRSGDRVVFIEDTAHCADMRSQRVTDRSSLQTARAVHLSHARACTKPPLQQHTPGGQQAHNKPV